MAQASIPCMARLGTQGNFEIYRKTAGGRQIPMRDGPTKSYLERVYHFLHSPDEVAQFGVVLLQKRYARSTGRAYVEVSICDGDFPIRMYKHDGYSTIQLGLPFEEGGDELRTELDRKSDENHEDREVMDIMEAQGFEVEG